MFHVASVNFQRDLKDIGERRLQDGPGKAKAEFVSRLLYYILQPHYILYYANYQLSSDMSTYYLFFCDLCFRRLMASDLVIHLKITV